ncbi:alpha/beta hydrolase [Halobacteriales archaeon QS_8_69_26]|nr:MAG: alpha/beta hydrolase [Halobacteriales archaeon QS_8_69_26]
MGRLGRYWPEIRSQAKRLLVWLVAAAIVAVAVGLVWAGTPYEATDGSVEAVEDDDRVVVERTDGGYVLHPADGPAETGLVFYPGGRVDPNAYVGSLAGLVREANVTVVIPRMPLNLAIFDYGAGQTGLRSHAADEAMAEHPFVEHWYVGGHSLGGAMACRYAADHPDAVEGVVLYASYCDVDVSEGDLSAVSVVGANDTVLNRDAYERNRDNLPASARVAVLPGLNHTHFGSYTGQDRPTGTSYEEAHERIDGVVVPWLRTETATEDRIIHPHGAAQSLRVTGRTRSPRLLGEGHGPRGYSVRGTVPAATR